MEIFARETKVSVKEVNNYMQVTSSLKDRVHEIELVLAVAPGSMEIKAATARMIQVPYEVCTQALESLKLIIGLKIQTGINRQVAELIGGTKGCVHLNDLLKVAFTGAVQSDTRITLKDKDGVDKTKDLESIFRNTCIRYTEENSILNK